MTSKKTRAQHNCTRFPRFADRREIQKNRTKLENAINNGWFPEMTDVDNFTAKTGIDRRDYNRMAYDNFSRLYQVYVSLGGHLKKSIWAKTPEGREAELKARKEARKICLMSANSGNDMEANEKDFAWHKAKMEELGMKKYREYMRKRSDEFFGIVYD